MIKRHITKELREAARECPVVTILGPRQSGKTTLARMTFPRKPYASLEDLDTRAIASTDPRGFLASFPRGAILDEIQRAPELLSYIQTHTDRRGHKGEFILTGSHQPLLHAAITQTLAGRTAVLTLLPFSLEELRSYKERRDPYALIVEGCFPRLHEERLSPHRFFNAYLQTYVERDVRSLLNLKDLRRFQQFLALVSGRIGQIVNYHSLANDLGVSGMTVKSWISVLIASYVLFEVPPFFENVNKRVIKSPKLYFTDTGLAAFLLGINTKEQVIRDPSRGALFENLLIVDILKNRANVGISGDLFFYRDTNGNEVDLVIRQGRRLVPVEIKSSSTFHTDFLKGITRFHEATGNSSTPGAVLYNGPDRHEVHSTEVFNPFTHTGLVALARGERKDG